MLATTERRKFSKVSINLMYTSFLPHDCAIQER